MYDVVLLIDINRVFIRIQRFAERYCSCVTLSCYWTRKRVPMATNVVLVLVLGVLVVIRFSIP